jgi:hypothetical protein
VVIFREDGAAWLCQPFKVTGLEYGPGDSLVTDLIAELLLQGACWEYLQPHDLIFSNADARLSSLLCVKDRSVDTIISELRGGCVQKDFFWGSITMTDGLYYGGVGGLHLYIFNWETIAQKKIGITPPRLAMILMPHLTSALDMPLDIRRLVCEYFVGSSWTG